MGKRSEISKQKVVEGRERNQKEGKGDGQSWRLEWLSWGKSNISLSFAFTPFYFGNFVRSQRKSTESQIPHEKPNEF